MLHFESVETSTLELIVSLQDKDYLKGFYLVGGTALALYIGHRKSVDIDLFTNFSFDTACLLENIHQDFSYQLTFTANNTLKGNIGDIKSDFLAHRYGYIDEPQTISGVRLISKPDIGAMKLNAISTSGQRSKDFIDIYYLMQYYSVENLLNFYKKKYNQKNDTFILKSLIYFDDVDLSDWPVLLTDPLLKWNDVRNKIEKNVLKYARQNV